MDFTEGFVKTVKPINQMVHNDGDHKEIFKAIAARNLELATEVTICHANSVMEEVRKLEKVYLEITSNRHPDSR